MRHVPGFDQGWRGYERQEKNPGSPIRSGMTDKDEETTLDLRLTMSRMTEKGKALYLPSPLLTKEGKRKCVITALP